VGIVRSQKDKSLLQIPLAQLEIWKSRNQYLGSTRNHPVIQKAQGKLATEPVHPQTGPSSRRGGLDPETPKPQTPVESPARELWVVQDLLSGDCFSGSWRGFKPEPMRWKVYDNDASARKAAGKVRLGSSKRRNDGDRDIHAVTFDQAKELLHRKLHHIADDVKLDSQLQPVTPLPPAEPAATSPVAQPAGFVLWPDPPAVITEAWAKAMLELAAAAENLVKASQAKAAAIKAEDEALITYKAAQEALAETSKGVADDGSGSTTTQATEEVPGTPATGEAGKTAGAGV
jgi:hypothetical protein